jgi:hypothetical protein
VSGDSPQITVEQIHRIKRPRTGHWVFQWRIENRTDHSLRLCSVRAPHGKFKADESKLKPGLEIGSGKNSSIELMVVCDEPAGAIVENAFLILLVEWLQAKWRLFVRLRVTIDQKGEPETVTELITTQRVGFSGVG